MRSRLREFRKELGWAATVTGAFVGIEDIFVHAGAPGHEHLFAAICRLDDPAIYAREHVDYAGEDGAS